MPDIRLNTRFDARRMPLAGPGFYDDFERPAAPMLGVTSRERRPWMMHGDHAISMIVSGGQAVAPPGTETIAGYQTVDAETAVGTLTARLGAPGERQGGLCYGVNSDRKPLNFNRLLLRDGPDRPVYTIQRFANGVLAATVATAVTSAPNDLVQVVLTENTHEIRINGTTIAGPSAWTPTGTRHGFLVIPTGSGVAWNAIQFTPGAS